MHGSPQLLSQPTFSMFYQFGQIAIDAVVLKLMITMLLLLMILMLLLMILLLLLMILLLLLMMMVTVMVSQPGFNHSVSEDGRHMHSHTVQRVNLDRE